MVETPVISIDPTPVEDGQNFTVRCITASNVDGFIVIFYEGSNELAPQDSTELQRVANLSSASSYTCKISTDNQITNSSVSKPETPTSKWFPHTCSNTKLYYPSHCPSTLIPLKCRHLLCSYFSKHFYIIMLHLCHSFVYFHVKLTKIFALMPRSDYSFLQHMPHMSIIFVFLWLLTFLLLPLASCLSLLVNVLPFRKLFLV